MNDSKTKKLIDSENGIGFSNNVNIKGYKFIKHNSFIIFEMKVIDNVRVAHVKYLFFDNTKDLLTLFATACKFWMGNKIEFFVFKEHHKLASAKDLFLEFGFTERVQENVNWPYDYKALDPEHKNTLHLIYR